MTVEELIERLQELSPTAEVRVMSQKNYPMQGGVHGVCEHAELRGPQDEKDDEDSDDKDALDVVYVVEGEWIGYGDKRAWSTEG